MGLARPSHATEICDPANNSPKEQANQLWQTSCVSTCSKILEKSSSSELSSFGKNCESYRQDQEKPFSFMGGVKTTGKILDQALLRCLPIGAKKSVVGAYEFVTSLPSMIGYLLSYKGERGASGPDMASVMQTCAQSVECKRALARNTIRFQDRNPDGSFKVSDEELDRHIGSMSFNDIHQQAIHDLPMTQQECGRELAQIRRNVSSDGEDWTKARHQKVYDELSKRLSYCSAALNLTPPNLLPDEEFEGPISQEECFRREKHPMKCLSLLDKMAVTRVCMGQDEYDKMSVDFCSEVVQFFIPLPFLGPASKALPAIVKGGRAAENAVTATTATRAAVQGIEAEAQQVAKGAAEAVATGGRSEIANGARIRVPGSNPTSTTTATTTVTAPKVLTPAQKNFVTAYKEKIFVGEAQNSRYIAMAEDSTATAAANKTRFFDVENSVMKKLNDKTNNKDLVTSITNHQKETLINRLDALKKKYPDMDFELYSDFKSVKVGIKSKTEIDPVTHKKLLADLETAYAESNKEVVAKMKELNIEVPEAGDAKDWFKAGFGRSTDEASLAARKARQESGSGVLDFTNAEVRSKIQDNMAHVERQREALADSPKFKNLMERDSQGHSLPSEEVFDLVRKTDNPDQLAGIVSRRYGVKDFNATDAAQLQNYAKSVDELQPPILMSKRELMSLDSANKGGATADFLGMGSANLRATAEGVAGKTSLESAITGIRQGEKKVTQTFKERMDAFKKKVKNANCSGDDCETATAIATKDKLKIMNSLAADDKTKKIRMAFFAEGVPAESRRQIASHGESLEKAFRKELEDKIPYSKMKNITVGFDMKSQELNRGTVDLLIGKQGQVKFTSQEQREIQEAFARALDNVGKEAKGYSQGTAQFSQTPQVQGSLLLPKVIGADDEDQP